MVKRFNGALQIHIRQYERDGKGGSYPTKVGIALTPTRFMVLLSFIDTLKSNVERLRNRDQHAFCKIHLGGGIFATLSSDFRAVNIRRFFQPQGEIVPHPTKKGIALRLNEWDSLMTRLDDINKLINTDEKPCFERLDHIDPTVRFHCKECNPFQPFFLQNY